MNMGFLQSRGQPLQHDQQEQISSEENCVGGDQHENEDPELSGEQRFLAEGNDPPPQHDQQERASSEEPGLGDAQHALSQSPGERSIGDHQCEELELTDAERPSADVSDQSQQHDQQEQVSPNERGLGDAQHEGSELLDAPPGMGDADNQNDAELTDEQGPSSSSSSRSSSEVEAESEDECPLHDRVDNYRSAAKDDRRQVYMWTYARAPEMSREDVATVITNAYAAAGVQILHYPVFREHHPTSRSELERQFHFHIIVESDERHRWRAIARVLRSQDRPMHCSAAGSGRSVYWGAFAYCYVPSAKKPREHLADGGDDRWLSVAYGTQAKRLQEQIAAVWAVETAGRRLEDRDASHFDILSQGLRHTCSCNGRAIPGWNFLLEHNGIAIADYRDSIVRLFQSGGGKGMNHFYYGAPSSGKTALTRPILALFKQYVMLKPQVATSFPLHTLIGKKALVWNDFRFPHPPLSWGDLLNILDCKPFLIGVPKGGEGAQDYMWNVNHSENVIVFMTSQHPIQGPTHLDTMAWDSRFGSMLHFPHTLPNPDPAFKKIFSCTKCYASWILQRDQEVRVRSRSR
ncbi:unnamed protein product [Cladocopium goreaui]|uniref:Parvovirus non-structural protein 1 helicase domain-containing protein n=1 Tax=Cladocopium goreaui TaxID=2562237 RepID=A0A9P1DBK7_9DINO|nr:unnamed protein product [Cladocopium goreaui]